MPPASEPAPGLAFWIHQLVEYLLGILVISQAVQTDRPLFPVLVGLGIIVLAATADGPVAAFHLVPRPLHRVLDIVAIVAIGVLLVVQRDAMGTTGLLFVGLAAVAMIGLLVRTNYTPKAKRATPAPAADTGKDSGGSKGEAYGRAAGRVVGLGIRGLRNRKPPAPGGS